MRRGNQRADYGEGQNRPGENTDYRKRKINAKKKSQKEMQNNGCIGSIAELYDSVKPQLPKGAIAQGWSVAEIFR